MTKRIFPSVSYWLGTEPEVGIEPTTYRLQGCLQTANMASTCASSDRNRVLAGGFAPMHRTFAPRFDATTSDPNWPVSRDDTPRRAFGRAGEMCICVMQLVSDSDARRACMRITILLIGPSIDRSSRRLGHGAVAVNRHAAGRRSEVFRCGRWRTGTAGGRAQGDSVEHAVETPEILVGRDVARQGGCRGDGAG